MRFTIVAALISLALIGCPTSDTRLPVDSHVDAGDPDLLDASTWQDLAASDDLDRADVEPDTAGDLGLPATGPWRSALYPAEWTPDFRDADGRFLHDFSYAGYRHGEEPAGGIGEVFDVVSFGADSTGAADSRAAFQAAIDAASVAGGVVDVPEGLFRIDDQLFVTASNVVIRGAGASLSRVWFTRFDQMSSRAHLTFRGPLAEGIEVPLATNGANGDVVLEVADATALQPGDDVVVGWTISPPFVDEHAMTGVWIAFNDTWQPFFRRQVVAVDTSSVPHTVELDLPLRYAAKVRDAASLRVETGYLREVGVEGLGMADAVGWEDAWSQTQVHLVEFDAVADGWVRDVRSFVSPGAPTTGPGAGAHLQNGGIVIRESKRVTVADSTLELAQNRGGGGCGYLFEVRQSSEILFRDLVGRGGRHNFIQNWGFGATGIVWLRVHSSEGKTFATIDAPISAVGASEFHHSLAMANLIDSSTFDDGFAALNRKDYSTGAGHTATESVFWNTSGDGSLRSYQFGNGYVIGTAPGLSVLTDMPSTIPPEQRPALEELGPWTATWPVDWVEGRGRGAELEPPSLYEDQRQRRP